MIANLRVIMGFHASRGENTHTHTYTYMKSIKLWMLTYIQKHTPHQRRIKWHQNTSNRLWVHFTSLFIFLIFLFYFNQRLITLQYFGGFCHIFTWISHGCICVPHPDPPSHLTPHPIPQGHSSQCSSPKHSISCMEPGLVICFTCGHIYVSMLFSQIIPLSPSPTESKSMFFTSVFLLLSRI